MSLEEFPARLKAAIGSQPVNKYAKASGLAESVVRSYLTGRSRPGLDKLFDLARGGNVRVEWLATGGGPMRPYVDGSERQPCEVPSDHVYIPHLATLPESASDIKEPGTEVTEHIAFKAPWLRDYLGVEPRNLSVLHAQGDSMVPTIQDGDLLLLDLSQVCVGDGIYAFKLGTAIFVKRIQFFPDGTVSILSDNSHYQPIRVELGDGAAFRVLGRVVWLGRRMYTPVEAVIRSE